MIFDEFDLNFSGKSVKYHSLLLSLYLYKAKAKIQNLNKLQVF